MKKKRGKERDNTEESVVREGAKTSQKPDGVPAAVDFFPTAESDGFPKSGSPEPAASLMAATALSELPESYGGNRVVLLPVGPDLAHIYWEIDTKALQEKPRFAAPDGKPATLMLRVHGGSDVKLEGALSPGLLDIIPAPDAKKCYVPLPWPGGTCFAELGFEMADGGFFSLARSDTATIPPRQPAARELATATVVGNTLDRTMFPSQLPHVDREGHAPPPSPTQFTDRVLLDAQPRPAFTRTVKHTGIERPQSFNEGDVDQTGMKEDLAERVRDEKQADRGETASQSGDVIQQHPTMTTALADSCFDQFLVPEHIVRGRVAEFYKLFQIRQASGEETPLKNHHALGLHQNGTGLDLTEWSEQRFAAGISSDAAASNQSLLPSVDS